MCFIQNDAAAHRAHHAGQHNAQANASGIELMAGVIQQHNLWVCPSSCGKKATRRTWKKMSEKKIDIYIILLAVFIGANLYPVPIFFSRCGHKTNLQYISCSCRMQRNGKVSRSQRTRQWQRPSFTSWLWCACRAAMWKKMTLRRWHGIYGFD